MDPFLEDPAFWEGFHDVLITCCMFNIEQGLPDGYISNVKERAEVISVDDPAAKVYVPDIGVAREFPRRRQAAAPEEGGGVALAVEIEPVTIPSVDSIEVRDYGIVQGVVLFVTLMFALVNLAVDLSYAYLDPRIRFEGRR